MARTDFWEWEPNSYTIVPTTSTNVIEFGSGVEHRRRRWRNPRYIYTYTYDETREDLISMRQFFTGRGGQYDEFYVIIPEPTTQRFTAAADSTLTLTSSSNPSIENVKVQVDGIYQSPSTFSLVNATKVLTFTSPVSGTVDVEWYECVLCRFLNPNLSRAMIMNVMGNVTLQFISLKTGLPYSG